jgi:hypothetical protein
MSSSTGSQYYTKSMNGVISFDDGNGTTIEDDAIITGDITCTTLTATSNINTSTINTDFINSNTNGYVQCLSDITFNGQVSASFVPTSNNQLLGGMLTIDLLLNDESRCTDLLQRNEFLIRLIRRFPLSP